MPYLNTINLQKEVYYIIMQKIINGLEMADYRYGTESHPTEIHPLRYLKDYLSILN